MMVLFRELLIDTDLATTMACVRWTATEGLTALRGRLSSAAVSPRDLLFGISLAGLLSDQFLGVGVSRVGIGKLFAFRCA